MGLDARAGGDGRFLALQKRISDQGKALADLEEMVSEISSGETGPQGEQGPPGPYFTPSVSDQGVISWTNNGGLPNPSSQNIKGPQGDPDMEALTNLEIEALLSNE